MKIMILSDLHISYKDDVKKARYNIRMLMPGDLDLVVICGDIFESNYRCDPYGRLTDIFENDVPVICVLGNHEFFDRTVEETIDYYRNYYNPEKYNVHYLDIIENYDIDNYHFFGNVLWYDGSMSTLQNQNIDSFANGCWADKYIKNFDWKAANKDCVKIIESNIGDLTKINILCTHCCPHRDLNLHMSKTDSPFNAYSGMSTFLEDLQPDYAFCGHTHRRTIGRIIGKCNCVNVGNDLYEFKNMILDI